MSSDIWNTLWSVDFFGDSIVSGTLPLYTERLNVPQGGTLWVSDIVGAITIGPLVALIGWDLGYQLWVVFNATFLGWCTHFFAVDLGAKEGAWIAGLGVLCSGVFLSGIQNGASEGITIFWLVLSLWMVWRATYEKSNWKKSVVISIVGGLSSWYSALILGIFWLCLFVHLRRKKIIIGLIVWCVSLIPWAILAHRSSTGSDNLVRIKSGKLMDQVRRSIGPSDPLSYVAPFPFQSPDFSIYWVYSEDYVHSSYVGWVLILGVMWLIIQKRLSVMRWILWGIGLCFVLSLGPVLIRDGAALLFGADRAIPLPYFLLEYVWGFRSLTLLYRLSFGVVLGAALLVAQGFSGRRAWLLLGVMCMEIFFWSPVKNLPDWSTIPSSKGFSILKDRTGGVVLNHPVVGGNPYLFEQVLHEKSMMGTLNFPNNRLGSTFWKQLEEGGCSSIQYKEPVYLVSHPKIQHRPQREDRLVERALDECSVVYLGAELIIVELK